MLRFRYISLILFTFALLLASCSNLSRVISSSSSASRDGKSELNTSTTEDGSVSASVSAHSKVEQIITAPDSSGVAGASVAFPSGSLSVNVNVTMGQGSLIATPQVASGLGANTTFASASNSVNVSSSPKTDTTNPYSITLPFPKSTALTDDLSHVVVIYEHQSATTGLWKTGIVAPSDLTLDADKIIVKTKYFGTYQAAITLDIVPKSKELPGRVTDISDTKAPVPGGSGAVSSSTKDSSITISWWPATDDNTDSAHLVYSARVYAATDIASGADLTARGKEFAVGSTFSSATLTGIIPNTDYQFGVIVSDIAGNKALYPIKTFRINSVTNPPSLSVSSPDHPFVKGGDSVIWTVTYTDATGVNLSPSLVHTTTTGSATTGTVTTTCTNSSCQVAVTAGTGEGTVGISILAGSASNSSGSAPASTISTTATIDNTAPTSVTGVTPSQAFNAAFTVTPTSTDTNGVVFHATLDGSVPTCAAGNNVTSINIPAATTTLKVLACDPAGNTSGIFTSVYTYDGSAPTLTVGAPSASFAKTGDTVTVPVTYGLSAGDVITLAAANITLVGTPTATKSVTCSTNTCTITLSSFTGDGALGLSITAGSAHDTVGNQASAATSANIIVDNTVPTAPIFTVGSKDFNAAFPEVLTGGSDANFKEFRYTVGSAPTTPTCVSGTGLNSSPYTVEIPGGSTQVLKVIACDQAGNGSTVATATYTWDALAPTLAVSAPTPTSSNGSTNVIYTVTAADARSFALSLASKVSLVIDSGSFATTPTIGITGASPSFTVTLSGFAGDAVAHIAIAAGAATDAAGNASTAYTSAASFSAYSTAPAPTITPSSRDFNATFTAQFTGPKATVGAAFRDYRYTTDGTDPTCSTGTSSTADPTTVAITVSTQTLKTITCTTTPQASAVASALYTYDITPPTITISSPSQTWANGISIVTYVVTYSGQTTVTLSSANITVIGTASAIVSSVTAATANTYNVVLNSFTGNGTVGITIASATAVDAAGNAAISAASGTSVNVDTLVPLTPVLTPTSATYNGSKVLTLTQNATTDANFSDFRYTTTGTAPLNCLDGTSTTSPSITFTGVANAVIKAITCDLAGNFSLAATASLTYDNVPPTVAISAPSATIANGSTTISYTVTYTGADTVTLTSGDITLNTTATVGATKTVSGTGNSSRTVTLSGFTGNGTIGITLGANTASDLAGNNAAASGASAVITVDTTAPAVVSFDKITTQFTPTNTLPLTYQLVFSEAINSSSFLSTDIGNTGTATGVRFSTPTTADNITWTFTVTEASPGTVIPIVAPSSVLDLAGNANLTATSAATPVTYTPDGSPIMTQSAPQRRSFFDATYSMHWGFWYDGQKVIYGNSSNGANFAQVGTLPINTSAFAVAGKTGTVLVAYQSGFDIMLVRGSLTANIVTWETAVTVLHGTSFSDSYARPAIGLGGDNRIYLGGVQYNGTTGVNAPMAVVSSGTYSAALSFGTAMACGPLSGVTDGIAFVPYSTTIMAVINSGNGSIVSYSYNGSSWAPLNGTVADWSLLAGQAGVSGTVNALAMIGTDLFVGGDFTAAGNVRANYIAKWDGASWSRLGSGLNGPVYALAVQGNNLFVGGQFTTAAGVSANNIAMWSGTKWTALEGGTAGTSGTVRALAISGTDLIIGGDFTLANGVSAPYIARRTSGSAWSSVSPTQLNGSVRALATNGATIYAGGTFILAGGTAVNHVAMLTGTSWTGLGTGVDANVNALALVGAQLYVGGDFLHVNGSTPANYIAMWNGGWNPVKTGVSASVTSLIAANTDLYVGGNFTQADGQSANSVARVDTASQTWSTLGSTFANGVNALLYNGTELIVPNSNLNSVSSNIWKYNSYSFSWFQIGSGLDGDITAAAVVSGTLYVGGRFTKIGGVNIPYLAQWNGSTWSAVGGGVNGSVAALTSLNSTLYVAGSFTTVAGGSTPAQSGVATWNGTTTWTGIAGSLNGGINAIAVDSTGIIYIGGMFSLIGSATVNYVAKYSSSAWSAMGGGVNGPVYALALDGTNNLYVGGLFNQANGSITVSNIAKFSVSTWYPPNCTSTFNGKISALAVINSTIYAGGEFTTPVSYLASCVSASWTGFGTAPDKPVYALSAASTTLMIGGAFNNIGTVTNARGVVKYSASTWSLQGNGAEGTVLAVTSNTPVIAGRFGVSQWSTNLIAKATSYSVAPTATISTIVSFVDASDRMAYYATYNGSTWAGKALVSSAPEIDHVSVATDGTMARWAFAWQRDGMIEYRTYNGTWFSPILLTTGTVDSRNPTLPQVFTAGSTVPILWTRGIGIPYTINSATITP